MSIIMTFFMTLFITACSPFGDVSVVDIRAPDLGWDNSSYDYGNLNIGAMNVATFTLTNHGNTPAMGCGLIILSDNINFSVDMDNCSTTTMAVGEQCTIDIASHPTTPGVKSLTISRVCENSAQVNTSTDQIIATGVTPQLDWTPLTYDFGNVNAGTNSSSQAFTLTNSGTAEASGCSTPTISDTTNFAITANTCGTANLSISNTCIVSVRGNPTTAGLKSATLSRTCSFGGTATTTANQITVTGVSAPVLAWTPLTHDYGSVYVGYNSSNRIYTLTNSGNLAASGCTAPTISDTTNFTLVSNTCGTSNLNSSSSCTATFRANPTSVGLISATISRTCSVGGTVSTTSNQITVTGLAVAPSLAWSPLIFDFGNIPTGNISSSTPFTLSNSGTAVASGCSAPTISDTTNFTITSDSCSTSNLNTSASCTVQLRTNPTTTGLKSATLSRTCSVGGTVSTTTNQITVTGTASPSLSWSPLTKDFGSVTVGANSSSQIFTLSNGGNLAASGCSAPTISDTTNFMITADTCSTSNLNASSNCTITVQGNPASAGLKQATISRTCSVGGTVETTSNQITVTGLAAPLLAWSPLTYGYGNLYVGIPSSAMPFEFRNSGGSTATGCSAPTISDTTNFSITTDNCQTYSLDGPYSACTVMVVAHPMSIGLKQTTISRTCTVGGTATTTTNQITATGLVSDWRQAFNVSSFNVLKAGVTSNNYTYYFRNVGPTDLSGCTVPTLSNTTDFTLVSTTCSAGAMSGATMCEAVITANPSSPGNKTSTLSRTCTETGLVTTTLDATGDAATYPIKIAAGMNQTCALMSNNTVKCWGSNQQGYYFLGDGSIIDRYSPVLTYTGGGTITDLFVTAGNGCVKFNDGSYKCWGSNYYGQLGGYYSTPTTIPSFQGFTSIFIGSQACAVAADTTVKCWGNNWYGQLGNGNTSGAVLTAPVTVLNVTGAISVGSSQSYYTSCALINDGTVKCWSNTAGGVAISGLASAVELAVGDNGSCARIGGVSPDAGKVKCWGVNDLGQVGDGTNTTRTAATFVSGITTATSISNAKSHTCALLSDSTIKCWGNNVNGQLGDGTTINRSTPVAVAGITTAVSVTVGAAHTCALLSDNSTKCWGLNSSGQLGEGINNKRVTYLSTGITNATAVARGQYHSCALINNGTIKCWGYNIGGQLGNGTLTNTATPALVTGIADATSVVAGYHGTCALVTGGVVKCWGYNSSSELGDGTTTTRTTPVSVVGITDAVSVAIGGAQACAVIGGLNVDAGKVKCWGANFYGQLGDGTTTSSTSPVTVLTITNATKVVAGLYHFCALLSDSTVKCWGSNMYRQLGVPTNYTSSISTPIVATGVTTAISIAAGDYGSCFILSSGSMTCHGNSDKGQLGYISYLSRPVLGINNAVSADVGSKSVCALLSDNQVKCWGYNTYGQLGDGTFTDKSIPVYRLNHSTATQLSVGASGEHHCAIINGGTVVCSGNNIYGQVGFEELSLRTVIGL